MLINPKNAQQIIPLNQFQEIRYDYVLKKSPSTIIPKTVLKDKPLNLEIKTV